MAGHGWARHGRARLGTARHGKAGRGGAGQGKGRTWWRKSTGADLELSEHKQQETTMADLNFVDRLVKGDVIEQGDVLKIMRVDPAQLRDGSMPPDVQLAGMVEKELHRIGLYWTVKAHKGAVYILTDAEAYEHNCKRQRSGYRKYKRAVTGMGGVDVSLFSDEKRQEFDMDSRKLSAQYMALKCAKIPPSEMLQASNIGR